MSKVNVDDINVDDIKVGDLVEMTYNHSGKKALGIVSDILGGTIYAYWSDDKRVIEDHTSLNDITGHWKVINFEEEKPMDELKVYTGKETIQALLEGKVLKHGTLLYRLGNEELEVDFQEGKGWEFSNVSVNNVIGYKFTEVATPQVGDWVRLISSQEIKVTGVVTQVSPDRLYGKWNNEYAETYWLNKDIESFEILSPEQVSEYKREQAFVKVGRKPNEFKQGDIVYIQSVYRMAIVSTKNNEQFINLHSINEEGKGHTALAHQLTPISFVEQQVDLS